MRQIAQRVHRLTTLLARSLERSGYESVSENFYATLRINLGSRHSRDVRRIAEAHQVNLRIIDAQTVGVSLDETTSAADLNLLLKIFNGGREVDFTLEELPDAPRSEPPLARPSPFLTHPPFPPYHCQTPALP